MKKNGFRIVSGTTDNHLMLVDLQPKNITGKEVSDIARPGRHYGK